MESVEIIETNFGDVLTNLQYDHTNRRMVISSFGSKISVRDKNYMGEWVENDTWDTQNGQVVSLSWAHPEFGQVIASCSIDGLIQIWEETEGEGDEKYGSKNWKEIAQPKHHQEDRLQPHKILFAPHHLGLQLTVIYKQGLIRIFESVNTIDLREWALITEFSQGSQPCSLSWCGYMTSFSMFAITVEKEVRIMRFDSKTRKYKVVSVLKHESEVNDVSWAPKLSRNYHLISTGSKDGSVKFWKLVEKENSFTVEVLHSSRAHDEVLKVEWNSPGTILASCGKDAKVCLWEANYLSEWTNISTISVANKK